jgi:hypothetical protein
MVRHTVRHTVRPRRWTLRGLLLLPVVLGLGCATARGGGALPADASSTEPVRLAVSGNGFPAGRAQLRVGPWRVRVERWGPLQASCDREGGSSGGVAPLRFVMETEEGRRLTANCAVRERMNGVEFCELTELAPDGTDGLLDLRRVDLWGVHVGSAEYAGVRMEVRSSHDAFQSLSAGGGGYDVRAQGRWLGTVRTLGAREVWLDAALGSREREALGLLGAALLLGNDPEGSNTLGAPALGSEPACAHLRG